MLLNISDDLYYFFFLFRENDETVGIVDIDTRVSFFLSFSSQHAVKFNSYVYNLEQIFSNAWESSSLNNVKVYSDLL